jgi:hypothetical protein
MTPRVVKVRSGTIILCLVSLLVAPLPALALAPLGLVAGAAPSEVALALEDDHGLPGCYRCGVGVADFDGDGYPDVVMAGAFDRAVTPDGSNLTYEHVIRLYRNVSEDADSIRFELQHEVPDAVGGGGALVQIGDFNGDGLIDFAVQFRQGESPASDTSAFFNEGAWSFDRRSLPPGFDTESTSLGMAAADVDRDGSDDLVFNSDCYGACPGLWYRWSADDAAWQPQQTDFPHQIEYGGAIAAGDLDGDGYPDLVVGGNSDVPFGAYDCSETLMYGQIHLNRGAAGRPGFDSEPSTSLGRFALRSDRANPPVCTGMDNAGLLIADVDRDGTNDVLIAGSADAFNGPPGMNGSQYDFVVLRNVGGTGDDFVTFEHAGEQIETGETDGGTGSVDFPNIAVGDLTGDCYPEVFLQGHHRDRDANDGSYVFDTRLFLNVGGTDFVELDLGLPEVGEGGQAMADFDGDGLIDLLYTGAALPYHTNASNGLDQNDASTLVAYVYRNTTTAGGGAAPGYSSSSSTVGSAALAPIMPLSMSPIIAAAYSL